MMKSNSGKSGSETPERQPSRQKTQVMDKSVDFHIDEIGCGTYQAVVFIFCAGSLFCESTQLSAIAGVQHIIHHQYQVTSTFGQSLLMTFIFLGFTVGTLASGTIGDSKGRRLPMLLGYVGMVVMQVLIFLIPGLYVLYILVFFLGVFAGIGIPAAVTLLSEVVPHKWRDMFGAALCLGFCFGPRFLHWCCCSVAYAAA